MQNEEQGLISDLYELMKHVSNTPLFEKRSANGAEKLGRQKRLERRKQKTGELVSRIRHRLSGSTNNAGSHEEQ